MADLGIKVSKRNYDVTDENWKQILHSGFPFMKIAIQGTGTLTKDADDGSVSVTIDHDLGYIPLVFISGQKVTNENGDISSYYVKYPFAETFFLHVYLTYDYVVTTTQVTITFSVPEETFQAMSLSIDYIYYICYDPAT